MMDVLILKDGRVLVLTESGIALYESRAAFDSGARSGGIDIASASPPSQTLELLRPPRRSRACRRVRITPPPSSSVACQRLGATSHASQLHV
jgi:hypothetical protein